LFWGQYLTDLCVCLKLIFNGKEKLRNLQIEKKKWASCGFCWNWNFLLRNLNILFEKRWKKFHLTRTKLDCSNFNSCLVETLIENELKLFWGRGNKKTEHNRIIIFGFARYSKNYWRLIRKIFLIPTRASFQLSKICVHVALNLRIFGISWEKF